jgi:hypothetical protein
MHQPLNELLVCPKYFGWFWVQCWLPLGCRVVNMSSLFLMNSTWFAFKLLNQFTSFKFFTYVAKTFASLNPHREEDRGIAINHCLTHCTEVHFVSFFSGEFITAIVVNPPERKLAKRISVHCAGFAHNLELLNSWDRDTSCNILLWWPVLSILQQAWKSLIKTALPRFKILTQLVQSVEPCFLIWSQCSYWGGVMTRSKSDPPLITTTIKPCKVQEKYFYFLTRLKSLSV